MQEPSQESTHDSEVGASSPASEASQASQASELSLDDLSLEKPSRDAQDDAESDAVSVQSASRSRRSAADRDTKRMESRLQQNLRQQQAHYARQRKLFEDMRTDRLGPVSGLSSSGSDSDGVQEAVPPRNSSKHVKTATARRQRSKGSKSSAFQLHLQSEASQPTALPSEDDEDEDGRTHAVLRRLREKAQAEASRRRPPSPLDGRGKPPPAEFLQEMQQQEASNDALRRQLELLRRLQLENNRFRHEARAVRERNEALTERDELRERELRRLRDEVAELDANARRDQAGLAAAAQTTHKLKLSKKRLAAAQAENEELRAALREAQEAREQLQTDSQAEVADLALEVKRWKRSAKQLRQQEQRAGDETSLCHETISRLEQEAATLRTALQDAEQKASDLAERLADKTTQCESVESSAAACVARMEAGLETVNKAHALEREKRRKLESARASLHTQLERQQTEHKQLLATHGELKRQLAQLQERWQERKQAHQQQLERHAEQLEQHTAKHKGDAATIGALRSECESLELRLGQAEAAARELQAQVALEARATQKEVALLRSYVETALRSPSSGVEASSNAQEEELQQEDVPASGSALAQREEAWRQVPELQFVQAAICALRSETMNVTHELQRSRHVVRQQSHKLRLAQERSAELELLREQDAAKMKELRAQRTLADEKHEIAAQEKQEVLRWGQQACEKNAALEAEASANVRVLSQLRRTLEDELEADATSPLSSDENGSLSRCLSALEKDVASLIAAKNRWRSESEQQAREAQETREQLQAAEREQVAKADEFKETLEDVERLHARSTQEQKLHMEQCLADVEAERSALVDRLKEESQRLVDAEAGSAQLQRQVAGFEEDLPVFATVLHLFVLVVQPLILQVSELLAQKRLLLRENAEFAQQLEQMECIGQVLKDMVPVGASNHEKSQERQRRRRLRRVIIAVFALNRFQRLCSSSPSSSANVSSAFGFCAPLKLVKAKRRSQTLPSQPTTVIKVLSPKPTLSRLALRPLLERLKKLDITEKVAEVVDSDAPRLEPSALGNLVLQVVLAMDPTSKDQLLENTCGGFHCQALLERRRRIARKPAAVQHDERIGEYDSALSVEETIPTVALIRKRILALGKRVEDLHYQRNALQKENYEFQFQLEQQAASLEDMEALAKKTEALQEEMAAMQAQNDQELQSTQQERQDREQEMNTKQEELADAHRKIEALEAEATCVRERVVLLEDEKTTLEAEIARMRDLSAEEEEKADKSRVTARRQEEETRSLKQAVRQAHELYQKVSWQLEQEVQEKANLQSAVEHWKRQHEKAARELREEKLKELERSFDDGERSEDGGDRDSDGVGAARQSRRKPKLAAYGEVSVSATSNPKTARVTAPSTKANTENKSSFVDFLDVSSPKTYQQYEGPVSTHASWQRGYEDEVEDSPKQASISPPASISPLPTQARTTSGARRTEEEESFLSEWQRLDMSGALTGVASQEPNKRRAPMEEGGGEFFHTPKASEKNDLTWEPDRPARGVGQNTRRRVEINRVNAAVHDYMDRIDDKLSKMYGIPPSTTIQRSAATNFAPASARSGGSVSGSSIGGSPRAGKRCDQEGDRETSRRKASELREQQYSYDSSRYDND